MLFRSAAMMSRKDDIVMKMRGGVEGACERKGVTVVKGEGIIEGDAVVVDGTRYEYDHLIVAVGTEPAGLPGIDMDSPAVLTSNDVLVMPDVPGSMIILGAGVIGCEFASLFQPLGVQIHAGHLAWRGAEGAASAAAAPADRHRKLIAQRRRPAAHQHDRVAQRRRRHPAGQQRAEAPAEIGRAHV